MTEIKNLIRPMLSPITKQDIRIITIGGVAAAILGVTAGIAAMNWVKSEGVSLTPRSQGSYIKVSIIKPLRFHI